MTDPQTAADAALREWLDNRQAEIERDHRDGWTGRTCYCDSPKPCTDRAYELAMVEGLRALLADRARMAAELEQWRAELERNNSSETWLAERNEELRDERDAARAELERLRGATVWGAFDDEGRLLRPLVLTLDAVKDVAIDDYKHHWSHTDEPYDWRELVGECEPDYALWQGGYTGWKVRRLPIATGRAEAVSASPTDGLDAEGVEKGPEGPAEAPGYDSRPPA